MVDEKRIQPHVLRAIRRRLYHRMMSALHLAMADGDCTYELAAKRSGRTVAVVRRAMWDETLYERPDALDIVSDLLLSMNGSELSYSAMPAAPVALPKKARP